jgi:phosphate transport system substrate-binding protein
MKKFSILLLIIFSSISIFGLYGCGGPADKIVIRGSTSVEPLMNALLDKYLEIGKYDIEFDIDCQGTSAGIISTKNDKSGTVFGMSSSTLNDADLPHLSNVFTLALDAIVVIVNKDNPVSDLSMDEVYEIFTGKTKKFEGVSGEILVVNREAGSGTRDAFDSLIKYSKDGAEKGFSLAKDAGGKGRKQEYVFPASAEFLSSTSAVLSKVASTSSAIGYTSLGTLTNLVKSLSIGGVAPTSENVLSGMYKLQRSFMVFTSKAELTQPAKDFLRFLQSSEAQEIVLAMKFVQQLEGALPYLSGE